MSPFVDVLVVVALVAFYGGLSRELSSTADFLDVRLGMGFSLGVYVSVGVGALLSLAAVAVETMSRFRADEPLLSIVGVAAGLAVAFVLAFSLFFKLGVVTYGLLLRVGLALP